MPTLTLQDLQAYGSAPAESAPPQTGQPQTLTLQDLQAYGSPAKPDPYANLGPVGKIPVVRGTLDVAAGAGGALATHAVNAYQLLRQIPGADKVLPDLSHFQDAIKDATPDNTPGHVGRFLEGATEFTAPAGKVEELMHGTPLLARSAAQGGTAAAVSGVQSGGDSTEMATAGVLGAAAPLVGAALKAAPRAFDADPVTAINKALTLPPNYDTSRLAGALADVRANEAPGVPVTGNDSLIKTIEQAKLANRDAFTEYMNAAAGKSVPGHTITGATVQNIPASLWVEHPDQAMKLIKNAGGYSRDFSVEELETLLKEKNADLESFYNQAPGRQAAIVQSMAPEAVVKAQRDEISKLLYNALDPQNGGAGPREIQARYGAIDDLHDAARGRSNSIGREQPVSDAAKLVDYGQALGKIIKLDPAAAAKKLQGSDSLIRRALANTDPAAPLPTP